MAEELAKAKYGPRLTVEALQGLTIAAGICYVTAWLVAASLYRRVGLTPENVGIGTDFLLVRGGIAAAVVVLLVGGFLMPTTFGNWLRRGRNGDLRPFHFLFLVSQAAFLLLASLGLFAVCTTLLVAMERNVHFGLRAAVAILAAILLCLLEGALVLRGLGYQAGSADGPGLESHGLPLSPVIYASAIWLLLVIATAIATGSMLGERVLNGHPVQMVFNIRPVSVYESAQAYMRKERFLHDEVNPLACGLLLGYGDGMVRILDESDKVVSFPLGQVVILHNQSGEVKRCQP
jgi:hypothetical protein